MTDESTVASSPTTSIRTALLSLSSSALLSVVLGAQGIIHAGHGMADGPERTVALAVGNAGLSAARQLHLTGFWETAQTALGRPQDISTPPLLASLSTEPPPRTAVAAGDANGVVTSSLVRRPELGWPLLPTVRHAPRPVAATATGSRSRPVPLNATRHTPQRHSALQRIPTRRDPLRVLITGDSLPGFLGPQLLSGLAPGHRVKGWTEVHDGTGLVRPDYVDWSVVARQEVRKYAPEVTVVLMGGNDFQNMVLPNGRVLLAGSAEWTKEYARRAEVCMRIWVRGQGGHRVYWLSMPPARDRQWAFDFGQINRALQTAAAQVPGAEYINVLPPITAGGRYVDYVRVNGQYTLIREPDGVHLNMTGSQIVANELLPILKRDWHV